VERFFGGATEFGIDVDLEDLVAELGEAFFGFRGAGRAV
jgi:hypothetical protein